MRSGVPSAAHRLKLTHYSAPKGPCERCVSFPEINLGNTHGPRIVATLGTLVRRAKVIWFESLFGRWSKVVACVDSYVRDGVIVLMLTGCEEDQIASGMIVGIVSDGSHDCGELRPPHFFSSANIHHPISREHSKRSSSIKRAEFN